MTAKLVVIDTQLLVLLAVGTASTAYIARHRRTKSRRYSKGDFELLTEMINGKALVFVPHVLQETYYFLADCHGPMKTCIINAFKQLVRTIDERVVTSRSGVERTEFHWLGLADAVLLAAGSSGVMLLTDDAPLHVAATNARLLSINFSHKRAALLES